MTLTADYACCPTMGDQLNAACDLHDNRYDCPDKLVAQLADGRTGLVVGDGGSSVVLIAFCPWCGRPTGTTIDD